MKHSVRPASKRSLNFSPRNAVCENHNGGIISEANPERSEIPDVSQDYVCVPMLPNYFESSVASD